MPLFLILFVPSEKFLPQNLTEALPKQIIHNKITGGAQDDQHVTHVGKVEQDPTTPRLLPGAKVSYDLIHPVGGVAYDEDCNNDDHDESDVLLA